MKRLALLAFAALSTLVFAVGRANAQESFTPLVQKETSAIIRLDLSLLDSNLVSTQFNKVAGAAVDYFVADEQQAKETKNVLPLISALTTQYFNAFVQPFKDAGVAEVYVVIDKSNDLENPLYPYLAIPTAGMTEDQIQDARSALSTLNKNTNSSLRYRFARNGFLFAVVAPADITEDDAKSYVKKRFSKLQSVDATDFVDGFKLVGNNSLITSVNLPLNEDVAANEIIANALAANQNEELKEEFSNFVEKSLDVQKKLAQLIRFNAWKADLATLEMVSFSQTKSDADVVKYVELFTAFKTDVSAFIASVFEKTLANADAEAEEIDVDAINELKQAVLTLSDVVLSDVETNGSTVSFTFNEEFFKKHDAQIKALVEAAQKLAPQADASVEEESVDETTEEDGKLEFDEEANVEDETL